MKTTVPLGPALAIAVVSVILSAFLTTTWLDAKATAEEVHLVYDYIQSSGLPASWKARFAAIEKDWPPSRNKLAGLLLDAQITLAQRAAK